ncbi:hypothetical protein GCM10017771_50950 [Streptomyces capitiformicae]|uniref:Uncharacterized protein n=1 Tax=Streptomyces capitiformicae TaxID=2014920 RepID=A0A918Z497_9ACTN|nr:hypothetical protein GCM10017771_50950 [Streptomyces capitiformicae]
MSREIPRVGGLFTPEKGCAASPPGEEHGDGGVLACAGELWLLAQFPAPLKDTALRADEKLGRSPAFRGRGELRDKPSPTRTRK